MPFKETPAFKLEKELEITAYCPTVPEIFDDMIAKAQGKGEQHPSAYQVLNADLEKLRSKIGISQKVIDYILENGVKRKYEPNENKPPCGHSSIDHYEVVMVPKRILISPTKKDGYAQPDSELPCWILIVGEELSHSIPRGPILSESKYPYY
jgi:hypothetical protein